MSALSRREMIAGSGLTVFFALAGAASAQAEGQAGQSGGKGPKPLAPGLPGSLAKFPSLDSWIRIGPDGRATIFTGKAELGQGIGTALLQLAADELDMPFESIDLVTADTGRTVDEGVTAGSHSMHDSGTAIANAAANVRLLLAEAAAAHWSLPVERLVTGAGRVRAPDGRILAYGALAAGLSLHVAARPGVKRKRPDQQRLIGRSRPRIDIPARLAGGAAYVHDLRLPNMLHARVIRGPSEGTRLADPDLDSLARMPGVLRVVRDGAFAAILGEKEWPLVQALRAAGRFAWAPAHPPLPADIHAALKAMPSVDSVILDRQAPPDFAAAAVRRARYTRPYLMHGSIGPSCAIAWLRDGAMTVWTHSQGVYPLRKALAELLRMPPDKLRCIHVPGAGCYGHNGADDAAADAAIAARAVPGRPVRMLWSREQEHGWEPLGPAMVVEMAGAVGVSGRIAGWRHEVWSNTHSTRPAAAGDLLAAREVGGDFPATVPKPIPQPEGGGDRNAVPLYDIAGARVVSHFVPQMPLRVSALRSLGAHMNVFAIESFVDELAGAARRDPVDFRLAHLQDPRARAVVATAADRFGWNADTRRPWRGAGFAFARYKNLAAYCALAMDVEVEPESGRALVHRVLAAVDSGEAVNPDGIRNQIEGAIVQSLSWTGHEAAGWDSRHRTGFDWSEYPILRFADVPASVEIVVIDRPGAPMLGTGEAGQGPAGAAFANAVAAATGKRLRDMPLTAGAVKSAIGI